jgi:hypothetical protein
MLTVGDTFLAFALTARTGTDPRTAFAPVTNGLAIEQAVRVAAVIHAIAPTLDGEQSLAA